MRCFVTAFSGRNRKKTILLILALLLLLSGCAGSRAGESADAAAPEPEAGIPVETVETDAFSMDYFRFGTGEKTLVILPGLSVQSVMGSADAVAEAYQLLTDDFTIYLFDRRKELPASYSVYEMSQDTAAAMRALGLEDIYLMGVSQGGMMAMEIAIEDPELVHALALGSTSACATEDQYRVIGEWVQLARDGKAADLYLAFAEALYPEELFEQSRELLAEAAKTVTGEELERFVVLAEGTKDFDVLEDLDKIACPVLLLGSMDDRVLGAEATAQIAERLEGRPDFELYMYDGYGHAAYDTAPDYKARILRFFVPDSDRNDLTDTAADGETLSAIRERGVLRVGTTGDYKPMSFLDPETGEYWGFDTALTEDLAAALGVEIEYVPTTWPTLMEDTLSGKFDLAVCGITITDARQEQALMSVGYLENGKTVLCRAEDADTYTSLEAINRPGVRVMENPGGLNEKFARENLPDAELIIHDVNEEIPGLVAAGEADVMITETMEAGYYVGQDDRLAAPLIYEPFTQAELGVLMPKGSDDLLDFVNDFLSEEAESGRIDELAEEYIYRYIAEETDEAA